MNRTVEHRMGIGRCPDCGHRHDSHKWVLNQYVCTDGVRTERDGTTVTVTLGCGCDWLRERKPE